jgi:hypothetical protein
MALKTFNIDAETYAEFSKYCKENGISMSKKIEKFIQSELEDLKGNFYTNRKIKEEKVEIGADRGEKLSLRGIH